MTEPWLQAYRHLHKMWSLVESNDFPAQEIEARQIAHDMTLHLLDIPQSDLEQGWQNGYARFLAIQLSDHCRIWERLMDREDGLEFMRTKNCVHNHLVLAFVHTKAGDEAVRVATRQIERIGKKDAARLTEFDREDMVVALFGRGLARKVSATAEGDHAAAKDDFDEAWRWSNGFWPPPGGGTTSFLVPTASDFEASLLRTWVAVLLHRELFMFHLKKKHLVEATKHFDLVHTLISLLPQSTETVSKASRLVYFQLASMAAILDLEVEYSKTMLRAFSRESIDYVQAQIKAQFGDDYHLPQLLQRFEFFLIAHDSKDALLRWLNDQSGFNFASAPLDNVLAARKLLQDTSLLEVGQETRLRAAFERIKVILILLVEQIDSRIRCHQCVRELTTEFREWLNLNQSRLLAAKVTSIAGTVELLDKWASSCPGSVLEMR